MILHHSSLSLREINHNLCYYLSSALVFLHPTRPLCVICTNMLVSKMYRLYVCVELALGLFLAMIGYDPQRELFALPIQICWYLKKRDEPPQTQHELQHEPIEYSLRCVCEG